MNPFGCTDATGRNPGFHSWGCAPVVTTLSHGPCRMGGHRAPVGRSPSALRAWGCPHPAGWLLCSHLGCRATASAADRTHRRRPMASLDPVLDKDGVRLTVDEAIATVTLTNPAKRNAQSPAL